MTHSLSSSDRGDFMRDLDYLTLLSHEYPSAEKTAAEIINLRALCGMPKGTEYFFSDLHGEHQAFIHMLRSCSGIIKAKIKETFGDALTEQEQLALAELIYYPERHLKHPTGEPNLSREWQEKTILQLMRMHYQISDPTTAASKEVMGRNVVQVIVWGAWFLITMGIMGISLAWLMVVTGGLSTGIGFASKDIIENIYYGITLMTGRIKVGDWIQVDGTMGKVTSISYTSTVVESLYGEIITFQNSQLFTKNYKNLTRNHGYVLAVVHYGVAYGSNLQQVIELVDGAVNQMKHKWMDKSKKAKSVIGELADSGINLKMFVWADAPKQSYVISDVLNTIYDTLNKNGIEIPFPQQDVHIK